MKRLVALARDRATAPRSHRAASSSVLHFDPAALPRLIAAPQLLRDDALKAELAAGGVEGAYRRYPLPPGLHEIPGQDGDTSGTHVAFEATKRPLFRGLLERMKGLEPSTFCMARTRCGLTSGATR
jgi:hypothetical protein